MLGTLFGLGWDIVSSLFSGDLGALKDAIVNPIKEIWNGIKELVTNFSMDTAIQIVAGVFGVSRSELDDRSKWDTVLGKVLGTVAIVVAGTFAGGAITARYATPLLEAIQSLKGGEAVVSVLSKVGPWTDEAEGVLKGGSEAAEAAGELGEAAGTAGHAIDGNCSFAGTTPVLMADGVAKRIASIQVGDRVMATDPASGLTRPQAVTATWKHIDKLVTLRTTSGPVRTTPDHPFFDATDNQWEQAAELDPGDRVWTGATAPAAVLGIDWATQSDGDAYNLTVAKTHTYNIVTGESTILVHNTCPLNGDTAGEIPGQGQLFDPDSGVPWNAEQTLEAIDTGSAPLGYKGGGTFANDARAGSELLPSVDGAGNPVTYREWDVNPKQPPGVGRGPQRIVTGSDGSAYWTDDHYKTFVKMR